MSADRQYLELRRNARGELVRLTRTTFNGRERVDLRQFFTAVDDRILPTKKGINVSLSDVPALRDALERIEADALQNGELEAQDYERNGLPLPAQLAVPSRKQSA